MHLQRTAHYYAAQLLSFMGLHDRAISEYKAAIACDPRFAPGWRCVGFLHTQGSRHSDAIGAFEEALRLNPAHGDTRFNLAFLLHHLNRCSEAIAEFERVVKNSPNHDRAWYGLGLCRQQIGDTAGAIEALKEAACLQYFNPHAGYHLALAYIIDLEP